MSQYTQDAAARCPVCGAQAPGGERCAECGEPLTAESRSLVPHVSRSVMTRDFLIFELKLVLDGFVDFIMTPIAAVVYLVDMVWGGERRGRWFYPLLRFGERWDLWLNLYRPSKDAELSKEGLFAAGAAGADTLIGQLERLVREGDIPEATRRRLDEWTYRLEQTMASFEADVAAPRDVRPPPALRAPEKQPTPGKTAAPNEEAE
jgi:hypothetical protein